MDLIITKVNVFITIIVRSLKVCYHFEHIIHALTLFQHEIFNSMRTNLPSIIEKLKDIPTQIVALLEDLNVSMGHTGGADVVEVEEDRQQEQLARQQQAKIAVYEVNTYYVLDIVSWLILEAIFIQKSSFSMIFTYIMDSIKSQHYQVLFTENVNRFDINCKIIMLSICKLIRLLILLCEDIPIDSQAPIYETFMYLFNTGSTKLIPLTIVILYYITKQKKQIIAYLAQLYNTSEETIRSKIKSSENIAIYIMSFIVEICQEFEVSNSRGTPESVTMVISILNSLQILLNNNVNKTQVKINAILEEILRVLLNMSKPSTTSPPNIGLQNFEQVLIIVSADILSQPTVCLRVANTNPTLVRDNATTTREQFKSDLIDIKKLYLKANGIQLQGDVPKDLQLVTGGVVPAEYKIQYFEPNPEIIRLSHIKKDKNGDREDFAGQDKSIVFVSYYIGGVYQSAVYYCTKEEETDSDDYMDTTRHFIKYNFLGNFDVFTDTVYYASLDTPNQHDCLLSLINNRSDWPEKFFKMVQPLYLDVSSISLLYGQLVKTPFQLMRSNVLTGGYIKGYPDVPSYLLHAVKGLLESVNKLFSKKKLITSTYGASGSGKTYNFFGASDAESTTFGLFQEIIIYILARQHYVVFKNVFDVYGNVTLFNRNNKFSFSTLPLTLQGQSFFKSEDTSKHNYANSRYMTRLFEQCIFAYQVINPKMGTINTEIQHSGLPLPLQALLYYMVEPKKGKKLDLSQRKFTPYYKDEPTDPFKVDVKSKLVSSKSYDQFLSEMNKINTQYTHIYLTKRLYEIYAIFNQHVKKNLRGRDEHWIEIKMRTENYDPHLYLSCFNEAEQTSLLSDSLDFRDLHLMIRIRLF